MNIYKVEAIQNVSKYFSKKNKDTSTIVKKNGKDSEDIIRKDMNEKQNKKQK